MREIGQRYDQEHGLTRELTKEIFAFIQLEKRSDYDLEKFLISKGLTIDLWKQFTGDFFNSEYKNQFLYDLLLKAKIEKGIKILYTTNNSDGLNELIKKYEISNLADAMVNSIDISLIKPDPVFWQKSYEKAQGMIANLSTEEVLVLDDSETNIESAKTLGFSVLKYSYNEEVHTYLTEILGLVSSG